MKINKIVISPKGVRRTLKRYKPLPAIAEYVWNGFDAGATDVQVSWKTTDLGGIEYVIVSDNGTGIRHDLLEKKFRPFYDTNKSTDPLNHRYGASLIHGKNGYGRLTFFCFAEQARWSTVYEEDGCRFQYEINIHQEYLHEYGFSNPQETELLAGTSVKFTGCRGIFAEDFATEIEQYLALEFAWLLEQSSHSKRRIILNDSPLNYQNLVEKREEKEINAGNSTFNVRYVQWKQRLHDEYSRYYYINSSETVVSNSSTTLNHKGDGFHHSVYVQSRLFDRIKSADLNPDEDISLQMIMAFDDKYDKDDIRELQSILHEYLGRKRKPFLRIKARTYTENLQKKKALPSFGESPWDAERKKILLRVVEELYVLEPLIFNNLSEKQTGTMVGLLNLLIDSEERESLFEVLEQFISMESTQREDLARLLQKTEMSSIVSTIRLIEDRFLALNELKKLITDSSYGADEVNHLQTFIEQHFWLIAERYHIVVSAEATFERALREYLHLLRGEAEDVKIDHEDKNRQMDVFAVRWLHDSIDISNVVIELKHPNITLGEKQLSN